MASALDNIVINTNQRATSTDINDLQALAARTLVEELGLSSLTDFNLGTTPTPLAAPASRSCVIGGLQMSGTGVVFTVGAGQAMQTSASVPGPVVSPLDSPIRVSTNRAAVGLTAPQPGSGTWYWLKCQASNFTVSTTVDIYNGSTFAPTNLPHMISHGMSFTFEAGTLNSLPAVVDTDSWVYLAAVFCNATGVVEFVDVRRFYQPGTLRQGAGYGILQNNISVINSDTISINTAIQTKFGLLSFSGSILGTGASVLSPTTTLTAGEIYHLYLCVPQVGGVDFVPRGGTNQSGIVVLSSQIPGANRVAAAPIALPGYRTSNALNFGSCPAANCFYIGSVYRGTSSFQPSTVNGNVVSFRRGDDSIGVNGGIDQQAIAGTGVLATGNITPTKPVVYAMRSILWDIRAVMFSGSGPVPGLVTIGDGTGGTYRTIPVFGGGAVNANPAAGFAGGAIVDFPGGILPLRLDANTSIGVLGITAAIVGWTF